MSEHRPIPFRWIFPLGQLLLCWFVLGLVRSFPIHPIYRLRALRTIFILNLPAGVLEFPIVLLRSDKSFWTPPGVGFFLWQALSWPVLAIVFWWIAGRAVEALVSLQYRQFRPRVTVVETVAAFLIMAAGAVISVASLVEERTKIYTDFESALLATAGGLWTFLGGLTVIARFRQWRLRRIQRSSAQRGVQPGSGA